MKKAFRFSKYFFPAVIISVLLIAFSITGYVYHDGFALGVDFQAGLQQEIQIAETAFYLRWSGTGNAILSHDSNGIYIVTGTGIDLSEHRFLNSEFETIGSLKNAIEEQLEYLNVTLSANGGVSSQWLVFSSLGNLQLNNEIAYVVYYHDPESSPIDISEVRTAMAGFHIGVSVQNLGIPSDRQFMIRVEDQEEGRVTSNEIIDFLERHFGNGTIVINSSSYVDSRFSKDLTDQAGILIFLTLLLVLLYSAFRFKLQYAVGAVIAIMYDVLVIVAFVVWIRMEFTTLTIAAILTILGYSTNNTIILFDRIRENLRIYPDNSFVDILNTSLNGIFGRTIITTVTTMLAVLALFIFTTGSMKDFALALLVGMVSGVFTTLFIVPGIVNFWEKIKVKRRKKKLAAAKA
ncbi:MAG: protein translocase subunit SecF [Treponema sp.]|jgi:preprotein translocase subunit SecF|nr:protein translocase subunit SecF [Treponema sp.]